MCLFLSGLKAQAQVHPVLGKTPPQDVSNKDVLALPEREQQAWLHGAVTQMIVIYAEFDQEKSGCLTDWAFLQGNGLEVLLQYMERYPEEPAFSVIYAVANRVCTSD